MTKTNAEPAMPVSDTPEVDAVLTTEDGAQIIVHGDTLVRLALKGRSLERRLAQAQRALTNAIRIADEAQTRIAELEKAIYESRMPHGLCHVMGSCAACTAQQALDGIAIDSALKSRP